MSGSSMRTCPLRGRVDPRLVRFSAGATSAVLAVALVLMDDARPWGVGLLASQVAVFAFTAIFSFHWSIWAQIFARFVWPHLAPPAALVDARPPRFAQLLGLLVTAPALLFFAVGADRPADALTLLAFAATALNALTGLCLGCQVHHLLREQPRADL